MDLLLESKGHLTAANLIKRFCWILPLEAHKIRGEHTIYLSGRNPSQHHSEPCIAALSICGSTDFSPCFRSSSASLLSKVRRYPLLRSSEMSVRLKTVRAAHGNNVHGVLNRIKQDGVSVSSLTSVDPCDRRF